LVLGAKLKNRWVRSFLLLINIPYYLAVYWVIASLWKPEVQVGLEIQLVMIISLTLGLHLLYWLAQAKKKSKIKKKRKKERKKAAKERE
jgi:type VI protein secretion system component VasK